MIRLKKAIPKIKSSSIFSDYTKDFYSFLKIPESELFQGSRYVRIKQIPIILAGTMGVGKTKLVENIIANIQKMYGEERVNAVWTRTNPRILMYYGFKGHRPSGWNARKPIQVQVFDDQTSIKLNAKDQNMFCSMRHTMAEDTGLTEGVVYSILVTHDWYRLDCNYRRNVLATCFLSVSPLDRFSRREYSKFIGDSGVKFLSLKLAKTIKFDKYKGTGLVVLPDKPKQSSVGLIKWKNIHPSYWVLRMTEDEEIEVVRKETDVAS